MDLAIIGTGPAGLAAAVRAAGLGLAVSVLDEQPAPGGQIWRAVEARMAARDGFRHDGDATGLELAKAFRASGAAYLPGRQVWQIEPGFAI
ncbi:MAG: NAD(P)-binding protein, partial [Acetobacteraceae bacterium]|nr:NAD(P)-binding protein [Acetobacteraceae bacterium]